MILIIAIMYLAVIIQGGFFATAYLPLGILALIGIPFVVKKIPSIKYVLPFLLICIIYLISVLVTGVTIDSLKYSAKILVYFLFWILLSNAKDKEQLTKSIVILGFAVSIIGIVAFSGLIPIGGMVNVKRLQGVFQYANAMGIFTAACSLTANEIEDTKYKNMIMPMEIALLLTQSAGAILFYLIGLFAAILLKYKGKRVEIMSGFVIRFSISFISAAIMYLLPSNMKILSIVILVVLIIFQKKINVFCNKFKLPIVPIISCVALAAAGLAVVRGGRFIGTFAERLIQISDGVAALAANIFTGLGPGNWAIQSYAWQSLDYTATYIHSSIVQIGVDAGIGAVIVVLLMFIYYFKYSINSKPFVFMAGAIIILHSLVDTTFSFSGIVIVLITLFYIRTNEEAIVKVPRWSTILAAVLLLPIFLGLTSWNYKYNQAIKSSEPIIQLRKLEESPINSYMGSLALANLYFNQGMADDFNLQVKKIPYKTADVYYLQAKELFQEGNYEEALRFDYLCINESKMQSFGYTLALQIINKLPEEEQSKQQRILEGYRSAALKSKHFLSYYIKN